MTKAAAVLIAGQLVQRDSFSPVLVYDGVEQLPVPPAAGEVVAAQALVSLHHPLGPEQQLLLGRHVVGLAVHLNVRYLRDSRWNKCENIFPPICPRSTKRSSAASRQARESPRQPSNCDIFERFNAGEFLLANKHHQKYVLERPSRRILRAADVQRSSRTLRTKQRKSGAAV